MRAALGANACDLAFRNRAAVAITFGHEGQRALFGLQGEVMGAVFRWYRGLGVAARFELRWRVGEEVAAGM